MDRPRPADLCRFAQERLWLLDQLQPGTSTYNVPVAIPMPGPVDVGALERALCEVVRRHETLRTTFAMAGDAPVQLIGPAQPMTVALTDLRELTPSRRRAEARRLAAAEARAPFDLARGPLVRTGLVRLGDEDLFLLTVHHIAADGWSMGLLFQELGALYAEATSGTPARLAELPIQYADFAVWQRRWLQGRVLRTMLAYWKGRLKRAAPLLELPTDRPRPPVQSFRGATQSFRLPASLSAGPRRPQPCRGRHAVHDPAGRVQGAALRYTGQEDLVVGTPIANRTRAEVENLIGFFVNTLVLRTDLSANPTFRALLRRVADVTLAPTPTRTCRSSGWWTSCSPSGASATTPCSKSCSPSRTSRPCDCGREGAE